MWEREGARERENPADGTTSQPPCAAQSPSIYIYAPDERGKKRRRKIHVNILSKIKGKRKKNSEIIKTLFMILRSTNIVICLALNMRMFVVSGLLIKWFYPATTLENGVIYDGSGFFFFLLFWNKYRVVRVTIETVLEPQTPDLFSAFNF